MRKRIFHRSHSQQHCLPLSWMPHRFPTMISISSSSRYCSLLTKTPPSPTTTLFCSSTGSSELRIATRFPRISRSRTLTLSGRVYFSWAGSNLKAGGSRMFCTWSLQARTSSRSLRETGMGWLALRQRRAQKQGLSTRRMGSTRKQTAEQGGCVPRYFRYNSQSMAWMRTQLVLPSWFILLILLYSPFPNGLTTSSVLGSAAKSKALRSSSSELGRGWMPNSSSLLASLYLKPMLNRFAAPALLEELRNWSFMERGLSLLAFLDSSFPKMLVISAMDLASIETVFSTSTSTSTSSLRYLDIRFSRVSLLRLGFYSGGFGLSYFFSLLVSSPLRDLDSRGEAATG